MMAKEKIGFSLVLGLFVFSSFSVLALDTKEAKAIWPYDETVLQVRNESAVQTQGGSETMNLEFLIKGKSGTCRAYPTTLTRPSGTSSWNYEKSTGDYPISCANLKRLRDENEAAPSAEEGSEGKDGAAVPDPREAADKTLNEADDTINRVERTKSTIDWIRNF